MQNKIEFFYECKIPTATAQQRMFFKTGGSALPANAKKARAFWIALMEKYKPKEKIKGAIKVKIDFNFTKKNLVPGEIKPKTTRPDLDNLTKFVLDAMTKTGYFEDDAKISNLEISKVWNYYGGVYVKVENIDQENTR